MNDLELFVYQRIVKDMAEGVLTIGFDGIITSVNSACEAILGVSGDIVGTPFAVTFFEYIENDGFNQAVLDAIYENTSVYNAVVDFYTGTSTKKLFLTTSYLKEGEERLGVIVVINDVSELYELKDAIRAMEKIQALNEQLEMRNRLISETFGRYLSDEIVKNLLDTPNGLNLGGKKQRVTILMSDLRGFTAMSEQMEPADLISMLNHYLGEMTEIVQRYRGTIIEFIGDAIFAIFGAPIDCETPEQFAVCCAVEMQNKMRAVNAYNAEHGYPPLEMGIGVNTGDVILGNIGSEKRAKYGVVGQNVNLCGRIESFTVGGQVLVSPWTKEKVPELVTCGELEILPKGVSIPITIYEVAAVGNLVLEKEEEVFETLSTPIPIRLHVIDGKFAQKEEIPANILALSQKEALLDLNLPSKTNVKFFQVGKEVFAKFVGERRIHLTAGHIIREASDERTEK